MKKLLLTTVRYIFGALFFAASVQALGNQPQVLVATELTTILNESEDQDKYLPAGVGNSSSDQREDQAIRRSSCQEAIACVKEEKNKKIKELLSPATDNVDSPITLAKAAANRGLVFFTSHPGAFHSPVLIGDTVKLEDGSIWSISPDDSYKTLNWLATDAIVITKNSGWFTSYKFRLSNQNTGIAVEANLQLFLTPYYHSIYNHRIVSIDDVLEMIWLEDGSVWSIASADYSTQWQILDTIIIGINDGRLSKNNPNILINANLLQTARARCIGL